MQSNAERYSAPDGASTTIDPRDKPKDVEAWTKPTGDCRRRLQPPKSVISFVENTDLSLTFLQGPVAGCFAERARGQDGRQTDHRAHGPFGFGPRLCNLHPSRPLDCAERALSFCSPFVVSSGGRRKKQCRVESPFELAYFQPGVRARRFRRSGPGPFFDWPSLLSGAGNDRLLGAGGWGFRFGVAEDAVPLCRCALACRRLCSLALGWRESSVVSLDPSGVFPVPFLFGLGHVAGRTSGKRG